MRKVITAVLAAGLAACGGTSSSTPTPNDSTPTASAVPASGNITAVQSVVVTFSAPMSQGSLALGGSLAANASPAWASSTVLTIGPASTTWATGAQTLIVSASGSNGKAITPLSLAFSVDGALACSPGAVGACDNATDCQWTVVDLAGFTETCVGTATPFGDAAAISACVDAAGPTTGCSNCIGNYAHCGVVNCSIACAAGLTSAACLDCLDGKGCSAGFRTCSGR